MKSWDKVRQEDIPLQDLLPEELKNCQICWRSRWIHEAVWTLAWIPLHAQFHTCWYPPTKRWSCVMWRTKSAHAKPPTARKKLQPWSSSVEETSVYTCRHGDKLFYCMYSGWICIHGNHGDGTRWVNTSSVASCLLVYLFQLFLFFFSPSLKDQSVKEDSLKEKWAETRTIQYLLSLYSGLTTAWMQDILQRVNIERDWLLLGPEWWIKRSVGFHKTFSFYRLCTLHLFYWLTRYHFFSFCFNLKARGK